MDTAMQPNADTLQATDAAPALLRLRDVCKRFDTPEGTVTAVDRFPADPRFELVYHLHSIDRNERLRLKARISGADPVIESVTGVWRSANWYEREVFDLFGVRFTNHPDLRRILMPDDWEGHPLRKDYPITGTRV